jgi:predicted ribosome quality control (RQC) complex YloA/Tae2 family protein
VLRGVEGDRIPKPVLEQAAAITAYYSQARNASWVSVVYTQKKHVRKPKGANVGAVVLEREQTVMVKPGIPT